MGTILEDERGVEDDEEADVGDDGLKLSSNLWMLNVYRRQYYEHTNSLLQQYIYIDRLLDSSLPHNLLNEYNETSGSKRNLQGPIFVPSEFQDQNRRLWQLD
jgi:hypothetical protein